jgi:hypothetical protein
MGSESPEKVTGKQCKSPRPVCQKGVSPQDRRRTGGGRAFLPGLEIEDEAPEALLLRARSVGQSCSWQWRVACRGATNQAVMT